MPLIGAPRYLQQILIDIKGETDGNTIVVGDFNTPLTSMDRSPIQKINKATEILNDTTEQLDLINVIGILHPKKKIRIYIYSFQIHMEHSLGLNTNQTQQT